MEIEERAAGSAVVVSLNGRLDGVSAPDVEATVAAIVNRGNVCVVLDCTRMSYVSSAGLRAFLVGAKSCQREGGKLSIAHLKRECRTVIELSGFLSFIDYHATVAAAFAAPSRASRRGDHRQPMTEGGPAMEIEERAAGSAVVVSLKGRLDGVSAPQLEARGLRHCEAWRHSRGARLRSDALCQQRRPARLPRLRQDLSAQPREADYRRPATGVSDGARDEWFPVIYRVLRDERRRARRARLSRRPAPAPLCGDALAVPERCSGPSVSCRWPASTEALPARAARS